MGSIWYQPSSQSTILRISMPSEVVPRRNLSSVSTIFGNASDNDCKGASSLARVDSSSILHFDIFENAANVEKLIGSGAFTINDVRRAAGQPAILEPWADEHFMTKNISAMTESTKAVGAEDAARTAKG